MRQSLPSSFLTTEKTGNSVQIKLNGLSPEKLEPCLEQTLELIYFPPTLFFNTKAEWWTRPSVWTSQVFAWYFLLFPADSARDKPLFSFLLPVPQPSSLISATSLRHWTSCQSPMEMSEPLGWKIVAAAIKIVPGTKFGFDMAYYSFNNNLPVVSCIHWINKLIVNLAVKKLIQNAVFFFVYTY